MYVKVYTTVFVRVAI